MNKSMLILLAALSLLAAQATVAAAQSPAQNSAPVQAFTKVELTELHCMNCAKKIAKEVAKLNGVQELRVDLKAKTVFVMHKTGATPSAKGVWEAIETADHEPTKMVTPTEIHTKKPAS